MIGSKSPPIAILSAPHLYSFAHGLGAIPGAFGAMLNCITNDANTGLVVGQSIDIRSSANATNLIGNIYADSVNVYFATATLLAGTEGGVRIQVATGGSVGSNANPSSLNNFKLLFWALKF